MITTSGTISRIRSYYIGVLILGFTVGDFDIVQSRFHYIITVQTLIRYKILRVQKIMKLSTSLASVDRGIKR